MVNAFLYFIALSLALKIYDVSEAGPEHVRVGLSRVNEWFRKLWSYGEGLDYSKFWYCVTEALSYVCLAACCFWIILFIRDVIKSGRADGVGTDKNLAATFFLYLLTMMIYGLFRLMKVNYGPIIMPGKEALTCSFPSASVLLFIVSMGSTVFHAWDVWSDRKKLAIASTATCAFIMVLGIVAQTLCGTIWFTDVLGGVLLGITLMTLYSFFFYV